MKYCRLLLIALVTLSVIGCSRYDYYPRGIHQDLKRPEGKVHESAHIVKEGDTLYSIGKKYNIDYKILAKANGIRRPYEIYIGQRLYIVGGATEVQKKPVNQKTQKQRSGMVKKQVKRTEKHRVATQSKVKLIWPAKGRLSSKFGPRDNRMHDGVDIAATEGTDVLAAAAGKVVYADSRLSGYGNLIIIRHTTDMFTAYAHNQKNLVKRGEKVNSGQRIALMGTSGRSSGSHLHFEVRRGETAVDPLAYLPKQ